MKKACLLIVLISCILLTACTSAPVPTGIYLKADGSGDFRTLEQTVQQAAAGSTIYLGPGTYRLTEPLLIEKSLHLVGAGMDETRIVSTAEDGVAGFRGEGPFTAEGITFEHEGNTVAHVVAVLGGSVIFKECRFRGAVYGEESEQGGGGLLLGAETTGYVRDCVFEGNDTGIEVWEQARPTLERNICRDNEAVGIIYGGEAGGVASENECIENAGHGVFVMGQASPTLERNICRDNDVGIFYSGEAGGVARNNECTGNRVGIGLWEHAAPKLEDNNCHDNSVDNILDLR